MRVKEATTNERSLTSASQRRGRFITGRSSLCLHLVRPSSDRPLAPNTWAAEILDGEIGVPRTHLELVDEHAEVLADRDQRPMLVVHLHAQTVRGLRNLGNREAGLGRQRRAVDDQDAALKHLAHWLVEVVRVLELLVDELWSPAHDLADVGEAEHRQFAQNLLDRDFGPLGAGLEAMWRDYVQSHPDPEALTQAGVPIEPELTSALAAGRMAFADLRYWHEEPDEDYLFYLGALPTMLFTVAFELRPDWAEPR